MPSHRRNLIVTLAAAASLAATAHAGEVRLKSGGRLTGKVEQIEADSRIAYRVTTRAGTVVEIAQDQVAQVTTDSAESLAYQARALAAPDTPEGQLALARWCQQNHLAKEYQRHAQRVIELDPHNAEARGMLNFRQVDGQWQTRDQVMESRGMVWYEGKYRTRQDIELREYEKKQRELEAHWAAEVRRWRKWLTDRKPERVEQAVAEFNRLTEPKAAKPLVDLLDKEKDPQIRLLLLRAAARIDHQLTVNALVDISIKDPEIELRIEALDALVKSKRPGLTPLYAKALKHESNEVVNRAATALAALGDPSAISPLIDALVTEHKQVIGGNTSGGQTHSYSMSSEGTFGFGGGGPKVTKQNLKNPDVLTALVRITGGENFGYAKEPWHAWLAAQAKNEQVDLRRDQ